MTRVSPGTVAHLVAEFLDVDGNPGDPTGLTITITDPLDQVVVDHASDVTRESLGTFFYDYPVPLDALHGSWTATWRGVFASLPGVSSPVPVQGEETFEVTSAPSLDILTPDEVATALRLSTLSPLDREAIQQSIDMAVEELEGYLGRPVGMRTFDETYSAYLPGPWMIQFPRDYAPYPVLYLRNTPLISVTTLEIAGTPLEYRRVPGGLLLTGSVLASFNQDVHVVYQAGLNQSKVRSVVLAAVLRDRRSGQRNGATSVSVEGSSFSFGGSPGSGGTAMFTEAELRSVRRHKKRAVVSSV